MTDRALLLSGYEWRALRFFLDGLEPEAMPHGDWYGSLLAKLDKPEPTTEQSMIPPPPAKPLPCPMCHCSREHEVDSAYVVALQKEHAEMDRRLKSIITGVGADGADDETAARLHAQDARIDELLAANTRLELARREATADAKAARSTLAIVERANVLLDEGERYKVATSFVEAAGKTQQLDEQIESLNALIGTKEEWAAASYHRLLDRNVTEKERGELVLGSSESLSATIVRLAAERDAAIGPQPHVFTDEPECDVCGLYGPGVDIDETPCAGRAAAELVGLFRRERDEARNAVFNAAAVVGIAGGTIESTILALHEKAKGGFVPRADYDAVVAFKNAQQADWKRVEDERLAALKKVQSQGAQLAAIAEQLEAANMKPDPGALRFTMADGVETLVAQRDGIQAAYNTVVAAASKLVDDLHGPGSANNIVALAKAIGR